MPLLNIFDIAGSAMAAQNLRLNTTASNLANADSVSSNTDETYRARHPVFAARLEEVRLEGGEPVFSKGDVGDSMYLVTAGRVRVHDGTTELAVVGEDQVFGEFTVLHAGPRTATVTACEPTCLLRFTQGDLYELIADQVSVARALIRMIVQRLRENLETRANV